MGNKNQEIKKIKMTKFFSAEDKMSFFEENYYDKADYMGLEDVKSKGGKSNKNEIRNKRNKKKLKMTKFFSAEDKMSFLEENYYDKADYMGLEDVKSKGGKSNKNE